MASVSKVPDKLRPVSVGDLSPEQIEEIEDAEGVPVNLWGQRGSTMRILRRVLAAGNGTTLVGLTAMKVGTRQVVELASLDVEDAPAAEGEDDPNA